MYDRIPNEDDHARAALDAWRATGRPLDTEHARRVAAWWHSPGNRDLSRFSHGIPVLVGELRTAVEREIRELHAVGGADVAPEREELDALSAYCDQQGGDDLTV